MTRLSSLALTMRAMASERNPSPHPVYRAGGELTSIKIILADDHPGFPQLVEGLLGKSFDVVGRLSDGEALVEAAARLKPDLIITDISMPVLNGLEAAERLRNQGCSSKIIFLTVHSDADFVRRCIALGANGYVVKSRLATDLLPAIEQALAGKIYVSPPVRDFL